MTKKCNCHQAMALKKQLVDMKIDNDLLTLKMNTFYDLYNSCKNLLKDNVLKNKRLENQVRDLEEMNRARAIIDKQNKEQS